MGFIADALAKRKTPEETLQGQVGNLQRRLGAVGVTPPEPEKGFLATLGSAGGKLLGDYLQRPQRAVTGLLKEIIQPGASFEPLSEFTKGLTGETQTSGKELMQALGVSDKPFIDTQVGIADYKLPINLSPSGVAGFLSDMVLDPLSYVTAGAGGALKGGFQVTTKGKSLIPLPLLSKITALPEVALKLPGTAKAAQAVDKALDLTNNLAKFKQGFTQATRGFAPAGQVVRVVKEGAEAILKQTTKTIVPEMLDALKAPTVSSLPDPQTVDTVEQGLRGLFRILGANRKPPVSEVLKGAKRTAQPALEGITSVPTKQLSGIAEVLGMSANDVRKAANEAAKRGISEDGSVRQLTKALRPSETIPDGMKLRSVTERAVKATAPEVTEYAAPLTGAELLGYKVGSNKVVQALGEAFTPYFGLKKEAADAARGVKRGLVLREEEILNTAKNIVQIVPNEVDRIAITKWLDDPLKNALPRNLERVGNLLKQRLERIGRTEQEAGLLGEMWDTYVTHIYKDDPATINKALNKWAKQTQKPISTALGFAKERAVPTLEAAKALGLTPEYDIAKILAVRELASARAMSGVNFINEIKKLPYLAAKDEVAPDDFVRVIGVKGLDGMKVAPDVGKFLTKMQNVWGDNESMNALIRGWDRFTTLWKSYATVTNPGFSFRNMFGNFFNNWLGDVDSKMYAVAKKVMDNADGKIGNYTYQQVRDLAKQQGITQGFYGLELRKLLNEGVDSLTKKPNVLNPLSTDFAPIAAGRKLGEAIETNARMAHFIDKLAKGNAVSDAADSVRKFLFDYGELTNFEKDFVRRIVPFYTWTRKNVPLQLEMLLTKPGKYAQVGRVAGAIEKSAGEVEDRPRWMRESGAVATPITDESGRLILSPRMPYEDLAKLAPENMLNNLLSMLNPVIKSGFELGSNYQAFNRRPIEEFEGQRVPFGPTTLPAKTAYIARQIPFLSNLERPFQEERGADRRALDLLSMLAGIKFYQEKETAKSAKYEQRKQLEGLIALLKQEGVAVPTIAELEQEKRTLAGKSRRPLSSLLKKGSGV